MPAWTFITNHGAVLSLIAGRNQITARQLALELGVTERSVLRIIANLEEAGYIRRSRVGRTNHYLVDPDLPLRRSDYRATRVGELLTVLADPKDA